MIYILKSLQDGDMPKVCINGAWVPARPLNWKYRSLRQKLREAWLVFTGKAEAFTWPKGQ